MIQRHVPHSKEEQSNHTSKTDAKAREYQNMGALTTYVLVK